MMYVRISTSNINNEDILTYIIGKYSEEIQNGNGEVVSALRCIEFIYIETLHCKNKNRYDTEKFTYKYAFFLTSQSHSIIMAKEMIFGILVSSLYS